MAPGEPTNHVPSTPPNTSNDPLDIPQSSRRESSRLRTPISRPGFIATQSDSRRALPSRATQPRQRATISNRGTSPAEETSNDIVPVEDSNTDSSRPRRTANQSALPGKVTQVSKRTGRQIKIDLAQDSDNENSQVVPKKDKTKDSDGFDYCALYFYPPGEGPNQEVKASDRSKYNLKAHRDGANYKSTHKKPCAGRSKAIRSGCSLPPTPAELTAAKAQSAPNQPGTIVAYTTRGRFDNSTMIKILIIWLIRQSLPWLRMEDFHLQLAFDHAIITSQLPSRVWAAAHAHRLYLEQRSQVIKLIQASDSKVSLISDVWTTKGSHKAFVGITICYIDKQWKYVSQHLAIKYVSWHHNALTTDSGSNNFTIAKGLSAQFRSFDSSTWDVASNHHRCICHVIALILGAGLKELQLSKMMVRAEKTDNPFPSTLLATIVEEDETKTSEEIVEVIADGSDDEEIDPIDAEEAVCEPGWEGNEEDEYAASDQSGIGFTLLKIDYICRKIASNPQKQAEWKLWAGKLGYTGRGVIGGYGIRWNIAYDSRQRAYEGRRVIKQLLENESDKCGGRTSAKNFFNSYELSLREWEDVNSLNQVLKEFLEMTKRLEGDGPSLPMVLYEYVRLLDLLEKKKRAAESTALERMFYPMIVITKKYLNLAVTCDTVIMATFLHPAWRMMPFTNRFKAHLTQITNLVSRIFGERDELLKSLQPNPAPPKGTQSEINTSPNDSDSDGDAFNYYPTNGDTIDINTELKRYNNGDFPLDKKGCVLGWWKIHCKDFPVMASLARDYLACAASSASVEQTFSAAAGVCATGRASLAIQTIERCISSHMWLCDSVEVGGLFADCQALIDAGLKNPKFKRYLVKPVKKSRNIRK
ncbi:hypothetical protein Pst134EA_011589 [Puccinia striiformis f. sp. tritici]|uniref:hypothetical protein n=1 Tax=Puccinia striiformis f. sp. tritici TaxID=168172 RepID=UPI002007C254|nr:hypothetical protein Pst134EA_011589 [Puccinia striiformis f. sp. tritici]KAH9467967.1 hypothetical protein Pst134EA_011589 [Puccinia striiformis f. sp. tritici]